MIPENNSLLNETGHGNTTQILDCRFHLDIYSIIRLCLYIIGIIGNVIVVFVIIRNKTMRSPTFLCIGSLAAADFIFLFQSVFYLFCVAGYIDIATFYRKKKCIPDFLYYYNNKILWIIGLMAYTASAFHVVVLSIIRFITLVYPLRSRYILTKCRVSIMIICAWVFPLPFAICQTLLKDEISNTAQWIVSYAVALVLIAILHLCKLSIIKRTSLSTTRKDVRRMNILVIAVILVFALLPLPWNVLKLLFFFYQPEAVKYRHWQICGLFLISNHCVNPILYAFLSSPFQKRLVGITRPIQITFAKCYCLKINKSKSFSVSCNTDTSTSGLSSVFTIRKSV